MRLLIILFPLLLIACAQIEPRTSQVTPSVPAQETPVQVNDCAVLGYYHGLPGLSADQQQQALTTLWQPIPNNDDPCRKLRLALLLSQGDSGIRDEAKAEELLKSILVNPADNRDQDLALATLLLEVIELRKQIKVDLIKMRGLRSRLKKTQQGSAGYQHQLIELKSQLQQLQSLEQVIDQQEQAINPPKTSNDSIR